MDRGIFRRYRRLPVALVGLFTCCIAICAHAQVGTELDPVSTNYGRYVSFILAPGDEGSDNDSPLVAYENRSLGRQGLAVTRCFDPLCRELSFATLDDRGSSNQAGVFGRILRGADGNAVIVHLKIGVGAAMRVIRCTQSNCLGGMAPPNTLNTIELDQGQALNMDAAIGSDGFPVIAARLVDGGTNLGLWVIKCTDPVCELPAIQTQIDPTRPLAGLVIDLVIGASGFPQIAFSDREVQGSNGEVALLSCNDLACAGQDETLSVFDILGGSTGRIIDMKISASGFPVIAYAGTLSTLRVISCNDPICAGGDDLPNIVNTLSPVNQAIAMDLNSQGFPAFAAHSTSADNLEIIFCNDVACAGDDERSVDVFDADNQDIASGAWVDTVFDSSDRLQIVYQTVERAGPSNFLGSLYNIRCVIDGCSLVFSDRFEAAP